MIWSKGRSINSSIVIGVREGDLYKVRRHALYPSQDSEIKREKFVLSSPQPSGVAEDERVIFHQSSSDSKMESYKTSCLEKLREKAKKHTFDLIKKPIEKLQGCLNECHVTEDSIQQRIWKIDLRKVILSHQGKSTITSNKIYEIMHHAKMESCLRFSRNPVFDDSMKDIEMSHHNVRVQYVINVLRMSLLLRGSVKVSAAARPILIEWFPSQLTRTK